MSRNLKLMAVAGGIVGLILSGAAAGQATTAAQPPAKPAPPVKGPETIPTVKPVPSQPQPGHGVPLTGPGVQPAATEPAPLKFAEENFSFGKIPDTQPVSHDFVFTNTANRTVTIKAANAGCGCTTPAFKDGKKTYAAGESGVMSVTFNPQGRKGAQPKNVTITFEDPAFPQQTLNFTANVVPYVSVDSSKLFFQEVRKGTPATQQMTIIGRLPGFQVLEVRGDDSMSAKVLGYEQAVDEGDPVTKATVEITVSDKLPIGNYTTNFTVKTNDERQPEVHFYGSANVVGELRPNMPGIVIRVNDPSKEFTSEIVIDTRSGTQFEITDLRIEGPAEMNLAADYEPTTINNNPAYIVRLTGITPGVPGQMQGTLHVSTNLPGEDLAVKFFGGVRGVAPMAVPTAKPVPAGKPGEPLKLTPTAPPANLPTNVAPPTTNVPPKPAAPGHGK